ncbi:hypothetical protein H0H93_008052 [Arthromyces matolae]|nr:hypothetical protein H0H93_008052 [Arthromyces matolae]
MVSQYPVLAGAAGLGLCLFYFLGPSFKKNGIYGAASSFTSAWAFYGRRHDFLHEKFRSLDGQNVFTFNVLQHLVIVAKGAEARKIFFDDKYMSLKDGYKILHGAAPLVEDLDVYRGERINGDSIRQMLFNVILRKDRLLESAYMGHLLEQVTHQRFRSHTRHARHDSPTDSYMGERR